MKRYVTLFLAVLPIIILTACSSKQPEPERDIPLQDILTEIQQSYGEDYLAIMDIPVELIEAEFGITEDMYVEVLGQNPLMSTHPDRVVLVKATEGRANDVEAALKEALQEKIDAELQYPMNIPKTNAAKVVRNGNYVAFLLVGAPMEDNNATQQDMIQHYENEVAKAVDAFNAFFQ